MLLNAFTFRYVGLSAIYRITSALEMFKVIREMISSDYFCSAMAACAAASLAIGTRNGEQDT